MAKLTVEQRVQRAHVWLMNQPKYCLFSGVFMLGKTSVEDDIPTACTDGRDTKYGRAFMSKLPEAEVRAVVLHENLHKAFRHLTTWRHLYKESAVLANMACDYVINLMIYDSDVEGSKVKLPDCGLLDKKYRGMDAASVYRDLKKQVEEKQSITVRTMGDQEGKEVPVDQVGDGGMDGHEWESASDMPTEEQEQLAREVDQALRQGAIMAGKMNGNVPREVTELLTPKVDWREALAEFITSFCIDKDISTWRRPNRRWVGQDVYMPSVYGESVGRIVVGVDMSGSIGPNEIGQFLAEVRKICENAKPEAVDLLYWDTRVCQHETYEQDQLDNLLSSTKPKGGGGTSPQCIVDYINSKKINAECAVVLTDGYVDGWGSGWPCPTLWGITTNQVSEVGKTVHIN